MDHVYMLIYGSDWNDTKIILTTEDAIKASIKHPQFRVEIFSKVNVSASGYKPTYHYYKKGDVPPCPLLEGIDLEEKH